jgi:DNA-binding NarL/FixJ family response regulator
MTYRSGREASAVRILVADSRHDVRSALRLLLEQDAGIVVTAEAARVDHLIEQVRLTRPDVIILDCDLPGVHSEDLLSTLRSICPGVRVVALCARSEARQAAMLAGADVFISKADPPETLVDAIRHGFGLRVSKPPVVGHTFDALGSPPEGCQECDVGVAEEG